MEQKIGGSPTQRQINENLTQAKQLGEALVQELEQFVAVIATLEVGRIDQLRSAFEPEVSGFYDSLDIPPPDTLDCSAATLFELVEAVKGSAQKIITDTDTWSKSVSTSIAALSAFEEMSKALKRLSAPARPLEPMQERYFTAEMNGVEFEALRGEIRDMVNYFLTRPEYGGFTTPQAAYIAEAAQLAVDELVSNSIQHQLKLGKGDLARLITEIQPDKLSISVHNPAIFETAEAHYKKMKHLASIGKFDLDGERGRGVLMVFQAGFEFKIPIERPEEGGEILSFTKKLESNAA